MPSLEEDPEPLGDWRRYGEVGAHLEVLGGSVGHPQAFRAPALPPRLHVLLTQLCHRPHSSSAFTSRAGQW